MALIPATKPNEFAMLMEHPRFQASVTGSYSLRDAMFTQASLKQFSGNRKVARATAQAWMDAIEEDLDDEELRVLLGDWDTGDQDVEDHDRGPHDPGDHDPEVRNLDERNLGRIPELPGDPSEPPPVNEDDADYAGAVAQAVAEQIGKDQAPELGTLDQAWLEHSPHTLWIIVDGLVAACNAEQRQAGQRQGTLVEAYYFLLVSQLELIRYRQERGWDWAARMLDQYQQRIIRIAHDKAMPQEDWFKLASALTRAKVPVKPEIRDALAEAGMSADIPPNAGLAALRGLIDQLAKAAERPFDVIDALSELGAVMPVAVRGFMAHELALSKHTVLRDAVPLMLLDGDREVRRATASALEQTAAPDTLSPEALRRLIAVRNWIPEDDRPAIDRVIRKARTKGVACAQWPPAADLFILATSVDGSGAQSVITTSLAGKKGVLAGVLLKQGFGIRDAWCDPDKSRREINAIRRTITSETGAMEIERGYLDTAVQHAIAIGLEAGNVPAPTLLDVAEHVGGVDWQDRRLDVAAEARGLFDALDPSLRTPKAIAEALRRGARWMNNEEIAGSWYEDGAEVRAVIAKIPSKQKGAAARLILNEVLPKTRAVWAERFLLLALEARASKVPARRARQSDLSILAYELCGDRPLTDIPLMVEVAERSVAAAHSGAW